MVPGSLAEHLVCSRAGKNLGFSEPFSSPGVQRRFGHVGAELSGSSALQASQNRVQIKSNDTVTIVQSTDDKAVIELFEGCLANPSLSSNGPISLTSVFRKLM